MYLLKTDFMCFCTAQSTEALNQLKFDELNILTIRTDLSNSSNFFDVKISLRTVYMY